VAIIWSALSLAVGATLGTWVFLATVIGVALAWLYSAPPIRLKANGWWGNSAVALCYEGLPWITAAVLMGGGAFPDARVVLIALLYSLGAHGIMTLNDFKSIEGDRRSAVRSLPVQLGVRGAAHAACWFMAVPQVCVVALLFNWHRPVHAAIVLGLLLGQLMLMRSFLADPHRRAAWYSGLGVSLYVLGMLAAAFALRSMPGVPT
jgi:chlorophyll synthase